MEELAANRSAETRQRILEAAQGWFFQEGYQALNMDQLSRDLGMSKKTLYVHFSSKEALVRELVVDYVNDAREALTELLDDDRLPYMAKLVGFTRETTRRMGRLPPRFFRELQRGAPRVYRELDALRMKNFPKVFSRLIIQGQEAGLVRQEIDAAFATEFWRTAVMGLISPAGLERLAMQPEQIFGQALNLFFGGLLTPAGLEDYEKQTK